MRNPNTTGTIVVMLTSLSIYYNINFSTTSFILVRILMRMCECVVEYSSKLDNVSFVLQLTFCRYNIMLHALKIIKALHSKHLYLKNEACTTQNFNHMTGVT